MGELTGFKFRHYKECQACKNPILDDFFFCKCEEKKMLSDLKEKLICPRCKNYGYYEVGIVDKPEKLQMFCACLVGQALNKLSIEWRMSDIKTLLDNVLPRLDIIKARLHEPSKASIFIDELKKDFELLLERSEKALKELQNERR